jgi:hypothetical protein
VNEGKVGQKLGTGMWPELVNTLDTWMTQWWSALGFLDNSEFGWPLS